jgi:hypothetical protein
MYGETVIVMDSALIDDEPWLLDEVVTLAWNTVFKTVHLTVSTPQTAMMRMALDTTQATKIGIRLSAHGTTSVPDDTIYHLKQKTTRFTVM